MADRYIDNAMLKGRVKTGRSHLQNKEFNALEKIGQVMDIADTGSNSHQK